VQAEGLDLSRPLISQNAPDCMKNSEEKAVKWILISGLLWAVQPVKRSPPSALWNSSPFLNAYAAIQVTYLKTQKWEMEEEAANSIGMQNA